MRNSKQVLTLGAVAALVVMTGSALADHGKVGLWAVTTHINMGGIQIPPEAMAQMKAHGIQMPNNQTFSTQHCMTESEVKSDQMPKTDNKSCKMVNQKFSGNTFTGDMVCSGEMNGHGHMTVTYDSNTHYAGQFAMASSADGQNMSMSNTFEAKWISADCGKVKH